MVGLLTSPGGEGSWNEGTTMLGTSVTPPINKYKPNNAFEYNQWMKKVIGKRNREHLTLQKDQDFTTAQSEHILVGIIV